MSERSLIDICNEEPFTVIIDQSNTIYCGVGMTKQIMCPYQDKELDKNELYQCVNPLYKFSEFDASEQ